MKNVPNDWLIEIKNKIKENTNSFIRRKYPEDAIDDCIMDNIQEYLNSSFNSEYYIDTSVHDKFKNFFISIVSHQCLENIHPLTCGIGGGSHRILVPRLTQTGNCILVCPTCGWIQENAIILF